MQELNGGEKVMSRALRTRSERRYPQTRRSNGSPQDTMRAANVSVLQRDEAEEPIVSTPVTVKRKQEHDDDTHDYL